MQTAVYHSQALQAWEQRWFKAGNSSLGLMQQAAWQMAQHLHLHTLSSLAHLPSIRIAVWCGVGNNAGDGYYAASYLQKMGYVVAVFAQHPPVTADAQTAAAFCVAQGVLLHQHFNVPQNYHVHLDALFGIGLNRALNAQWQMVIQHFNECTGYKVALDMPSGLLANSGAVANICIHADITLTVMGYKMGLFTGQGKQWAGQVQLLSLIPPDADLKPLAHLCPLHIALPKRLAFGHKGTYGHVLVIGGHVDMGGAVIMSAQAAFAAGAGKVTVVCAAKHHAAILARSPNIMVKDIDQMSTESQQQLLTQIDAICLGMGLGRDTWAKNIYNTWLPRVLASGIAVILDADALWFLAQQPQKLPKNVIATPHSGEVATLLKTTVAVVESDRVAAIKTLAQNYAGQWVLKGAGSLVIEHAQLLVCTAGNPGMGTGGMGDVLSGMLASLKAQFAAEVPLAHLVQLHALAGDQLALNGERGLQACDMPQAIYQVVNDSGSPQERL